MASISICGASAVAARHLRLLAGLPGVRLRRLYSRSPRHASTLAARFCVEATDDERRIFDDPAADAVAILTEPHRHVPLALRALDAGKHVLVEKPVAASLSEAEALVTAADASGRAVAVVSQFRFDSELMSFKRAIDAGVVGAPVEARLRMDWSRNAAYYAAGTGWRGRYGSVLLNQAIHWLDLLIWLFGYPAGDVAARLWKARPGPGAYDSAEATLGWSEGLEARVWATTAAPRAEPLELEVRGTLGELRLPPKTGSSDAALERQLREFVEAVAGALSPSVGPRDGLAALRLVKACEAAAGMSGSPAS